MDGRQRITGQQASRSYKAWTWALAVILMLSGSLVPSRASAASAPGSQRASVLAPGEIAESAAALEEEGPDAVEPDPLPGERVVGRTAYTRTEANPDGTHTATISARPMHWRDQATGDWREYRNELRPATTAGYSRENTAGGMKASFETPSDVAVGRPVVRIATDAASLSMTAVGAAPSRSEVAGARIEYVGAYPDADLRYTVDNERVKEDILLRRAPATQQAATYHFDLQLEGLTAAKKADGTIQLSDASGKMLFVMPKPFMRDSSGDPEREYSDNVGLTLTQLGANKVRLEFAPSLQWLTDPARVYPVTIDPTVEQVTYTGTAPQDVHLFQCCPTQNTAGSPTVPVGKNPSGERRDTLVRFPELDAVPPDSAITSAQLRLYAEGGTNGMPMEVHANTATWTESTATWGSMPEATTMGAAVYGTNTTATPGWVNTSVSGLVRYWVTGKLTNHGLRVLSTGGASQSVTFTSGDGTVAANRPQLEVNYVPATRLGTGGLWQYTGQEHGGGNASQVNTSTGNVVFTHDNGTFGAHTYNSQDPYGQTDLYDRPGAFYGEGWTFGPALRLYEAGDGAMVFKDPSGGTDRVYARYLTLTTAGVRKYFRPLYYDLSLTKNEATGADPLKIYTLTPDSGGQTMYFDAEGKLTRLEDRNGNYLTYAYDTSGRLVTITDVAGRVTTMQYLGPGSPGRLSKVTDMAGRVSTYGYDADGDLVTIKHGVGTADEVTTTLGYGVSHHLISVTNPRGNTSHIEYRAEHRWDTGGDAQGFVAEGSGTLASQSDVRAFRGAGSLRLDVSGLTTTGTGSAAKHYATPVSLSAIQQELRAYVWAPTGASLNARWMTRDARNRVVYGPWFPAVAGAWTAVRLPDAHINPAYKVNKLSVQFQAASGTTFTGSVWVDHIQVRGLVSYVTDAKPTPYTTLSMGYDWDGRVTTESRPNTSGVYQATAYTYDKYGMVTDTTTPGNHTTTAVYDDDLRLQSTTSEGATTDPEYYIDSNQVRMVTSTGTGTSTQGVDTVTGDPEYTIDERNSKRKADGLSFVATVYARDTAGNVTSKQVNRYAANANLDTNPMPAYTEQLRKTSYTYGTGGLVASMTDPNGNVSYYIYNTSGYLTKIDSPAGTGESSRRITTIVNNADGSPSQVTDPKGQVTTYEYDGLGRNKKVNYGVVNGTPALSTTLSLDANGNLKEMEDATGTTTYTYDANDQMLSESRTQNAVTKSSSYTYHSNGQIASMTPPGGGSISYGYDAFGELLTQSDPNDGGRAIGFSHDYDLRTQTVTYPSGVSRQDSYSVAGRVTGLTLKNSAGTVLQSFSYDYGLDASGIPTAQYRDGFILSVTEQDGTQISYGYDDLGRLTSAQRTGAHPYTQVYTYDANDNRTAITTGGVTTTAVYDAANQLVSQGGLSFTYDRNGNATGYGGNTLSYNARNHWTGGTVNGQSVSFGYDGSGRRVSRAVAGARTDYWYDGSGMSMETGDASATYTRGPGGELLSRSSGASAVNYSGNDQGGVTALTSTSGSIVGSYAYDPWGEEIASTGTAYNPYRYTGTYLDEATDLYQMGARYYQSATGRFTQQDPAVPGARLYSYTDGNPVNFTDPSGLWRVWGGSSCPGYYGLDYHWWGSKTYLNNCQAIRWANYLQYGGGLGLLKWVHPGLTAIAIAAFTLGYWIAANNFGYGVIIYHYNWQPVPWVRPQWGR